MVNSAVNLSLTENISKTDKNIEKM